MKKAAALLFMVAFVNCGSMACLKSSQLHLKANTAKTNAEKEYYKSEATIYDQECAEYNDKQFQKRQKEEFYKRR